MVGESRSEGTSARVVACGCAAVCAVLLVITAVVSYVLGAIRATSELYRTRAAGQATEIRAFLNQHPNRFASLKLAESSDGFTRLEDYVKSNEDRELLLAEMQRLFGEEVGRKAVRLVIVEGDPRFPSP